MLHKALSRIPPRMRYLLRRARYATEISRGRFASEEPERPLLAELVSPGDWVLDLGANVGHYTLHLSRLVGSGRVVAFEPVPETFAQLAANVRYAGLRNVTLINAAVSDRTSPAAMRLPEWSDGGMPNPYQARITPSGDVHVLALAIDSLALPQRVSFIKVDVEGHELEALLGMRALLERDRPRMLLERGSTGAARLLAEHGYRIRALPGSPNWLALPAGDSWEILARWGVQEDPALVAAGS